MSAAFHELCLQCGISSRATDHVVLDIEGNVTPAAGRSAVPIIDLAHCTKHDCKPSIQLEIYGLLRVGLMSLCIYPSRVAVSSACIAGTECNNKNI